MSQSTGFPLSIDSTKPAQAPGIVHYQVFEELVIYHPSSAQAASLNESARAIWELCDADRTVEEICVELAERLGLAPEEVRADVRTGVVRLCELGLLCR